MAGNRCGSCNKFVGLDSDVEPEVDDAECEEDGHCNASVRIVNACAECGEELKEATFEAESHVQDVVDHLAEVARKAEERRQERAEAKAAKADGAEGAATESEEGDEEEDESHELEADFEADRDVRTKGKGRYTETFYGYRGQFRIRCSCGESWDSDEVADDCPAGSMDELG